MRARKKESRLEKEVERYGGADPSRLGGRGRLSKRRAREEEKASRRKAERGKGKEARRRVLRGRTGAS